MYVLESSGILPGLRDALGGHKALLGESDRRDALIGIPSRVSCCTLFSNTGRWGLGCVSWLTQPHVRMLLKMAVNNKWRAVLLNGRGCAHAKSHAQSLDQPVTNNRS